MKKPKAPSYVVLAIFTVITVFFWIIFSVLRLLRDPTPTKVPDEILTPVNPVLDLDTLRTIEERVFFSESEIGTGQISIPVATVSGEETP